MSRNTIMIGSKIFQGDYRFFGGIHFPVLYSLQEIRGGCCVIAHDIKQDLYFVVESEEFQFVHNLLDEKGELKPGICTFFDKIFDKYGMRKYYYSQCYDETFSKRVEIHRSKMIMCKPQFVDIDTVDSSLVWELITSGRLSYSRGSKFFESLSRFDIDSGHPEPLLESVVSCLNAMQRYSYRGEEENGWIS